MQFRDAGQGSARGISGALGAKMDPYRGGLGVSVDSPGSHPLPLRLFLINQAVKWKLLSVWLLPCGSVGLHAARPEDGKGWMDIFFFFFDTGFI